MKRVAAFFTAPSLVDPVKRTVSELIADVELESIVDAQFVAGLVEHGGMDSVMASRLLGHFRASEAAGADLIFSTCSSLGDVIEACRAFISVPIVRIDGAMADEAVRTGTKIGILATMHTTLGPTARLVRRYAALRDREITLVEGLADGAFQALQSGDRATHDRNVLETAATLADQVDLFLLAQGSMAATAEPISQRFGKPALTSLRSGVSYLRDVLAGAADPNN